MSAPVPAAWAPTRRVQAFAFDATIGASHLLHRGKPICGMKPSTAWVTADGIASGRVHDACAVEAAQYALEPAPGPSNTVRMPGTPYEASSQATTVQGALL